MANPQEDVYCTLLLSDSYLPGAAVLAHSLRDGGTTKKLAVLITPDTLSQDTITELRALYDYLIPVEPIHNPSPANLYLMGRPDLNYALTKIALWRQTQFRKIVYIDADVVTLRAPDELFDIQAPFAAAPDVGWPDAFNTGVMVISPNSGDYQALQTMATSGDSFDGADQGLLNQYYENKNWHRISFTYNCTPNAQYQWEPAYRYYKSKITAVHFIGKDKPWTTGRGGHVQSGSGTYNELLSRWFAVYDKHFTGSQTSASRTTGVFPTDSQLGSQQFSSHPSQPSGQQASQAPSQQAAQLGSQLPLQQLPGPGWYQPASGPGWYQPPAAAGWYHLPLGPVWYQPAAVGVGGQQPPGADLQQPLGIGSPQPPPGVWQQTPAGWQQVPPQVYGGQFNQQIPVWNGQLPPGQFWGQVPGFSPGQYWQSAPGSNVQSAPGPVLHQVPAPVFQQAEQNTPPQLQNIPQPSQAKPPSVLQPSSAKGQQLPGQNWDLKQPIAQRPSRPQFWQPPSPTAQHTLDNRNPSVVQRLVHGEPANRGFGGRQEQSHPTDRGVQSRKFSAPLAAWDATRSEPPQMSKPEAANFPTQTYDFSDSLKAFQAPQAYPDAPKDMYYQVPENKPKSEQRPPPIFPWEKEREVRPTRVFADDVKEPPHPVSASELSNRLEAAQAQQGKGAQGGRGVGSFQSPPTSASPPKTADEQWQSFQQSNVNAWDTVPGIENYVRAIVDSQIRRTQPKSPQKDTTTRSEEALSPPLQTKDRRESLIITDFPSATERPSLPVTPAPVRRPVFWGGEEKDEGGDLQPAEGVPDQVDWNPEEQLEHLRRSSLMEFKHLKMPIRKQAPLRELPEHSIAFDKADVPTNTGRANKLKGGFSSGEPTIVSPKPISPPKAVDQPMFKNPDFGLDGQADEVLYTEDTVLSPTET